MEIFNIRTESNKWTVRENHENIKRHQHRIYTKTLIQSIVSQLGMHKRLIVLEKATGRNEQKILIEIRNRS
jgi:hypothetical protein